MESLARAEWARAQVTLAQSLDAIDILHAETIPFLVFKGAAYHAEGLMPQRILADIDVLVRPSDLETSIDALFDGGWRGARGETRVFALAVAPARIGLNLAKPPFGDVDLHRTMFHASRADRAIDALVWSSAREVHLRGRPIMVPSAEIGAVVSLAHGARSATGDWALDVAARLASGQVDWDQLVDHAAAWRLHTPVAAGLAYLHDDLRQAIPASAVEKLKRTPSTGAEWLNYMAHRRVADRRPVLQQIAAQVTDARLRRQGFRIGRSDRTQLPVISPLPLGRMFSHLLARPYRSGWATRQTLTLPQTIQRMSAIDLEFRTAGREKTVRFDVTHDGKPVAVLRIRYVRPSSAGEIRRYVFLWKIPSDVVGRDIEITLHQRAGGATVGPEVDPDRRAFRLLRTVPALTRHDSTER